MDHLPEKTDPVAHGDDPRAGASNLAFVAGVAAASVPLIAVLQSPAFAAKSTGVMDAVGTRTALDPPSLIAASTAIATLGTYRLMKARARKQRDRKEQDEDSS